MAYTDQTEALSDLGEMFFLERSPPTFGVNFLDPRKLDFTVERLTHVDAYLERIRKDKEVEKAWTRTVLRAGAYVGEVLRRNDKRTKWIWIDHDDATRVSPKFFAGLPKTIATAAVLFDGESGFAFPLAKVEKYLKNGSEDSVKFFVEVMIARGK